MKYRILFLIFVIGQCNGMDLPTEPQGNKQPYSQQIIFLYGTTTAGKTSIAKSLAKTLEEQSLSVKVLSIDSFVVPMVLCKAGIEWINPCNTFVANEDLFKKSDMKEIKNRAKRQLCAEAISLYKQNNIVVIDAPLYKNKHKEFYQNKFNEFEVSNVSWILVYCPIVDLLKRVMVRNAQSSIINQRSIAQALYQFSLLYQSQDDDSIDQLSKHDLNFIDQAKIVHEITQKDIPGLLKGIQKAICPLTFQEIKNLMLKKLSFGPDGVAPINPVIAHDFIVDTQQYDSAACAQMILDFLIKNN